MRLIWMPQELLILTYIPGLSLAIFCAEQIQTIVIGWHNLDKTGKLSESLITYLHVNDFVATKLVLRGYPKYFVIYVLIDYPRTFPEIWSVFFKWIASQRFSLDVIFSQESKPTSSTSSTSSFRPRRCRHPRRHHRCCRPRRRRRPLRTLGKITT